MKSEQLWHQNERDLRPGVAILALAVTALFFWLSSRYPALNEKAIMGGDTPLSGLSFDILFEILPNSGVIWELTANSVNWIYTNWKGMSFGVLFGAGALTLLSLIKKRSFDNGFANSALGAVIGAPLGVCVNCAVPIAMGLHLGRMRLETTLSAMLASPTLNVIVVTMSFALLPIHLAIIKLVLAVILVLIIVPLLCRFVLRSESDATRHSVAKMAAATEAKGFTAWLARALLPVDAAPGAHGLFASLIWFAKTYFRSFYYLFLITVPMMLLAAVLGAVVATFAAPNELTHMLPYRGLIPILMGMVAIALVTSFVPAPIALDIILTTVLVNIGLRADYAMVALIGLGSFSVYAFIILWQAISLRTALALWCAVLGMAIFGGVIAKKATPIVEKYYVAKQLKALGSVSGVEWPVPNALPPGKTLSALAPLIDAHKVAMSPVSGHINSSANGIISVNRFRALPDSASAAPEGSFDFQRVVGPNIGLLEEGTNTPAREFGYDMMPGAIAAGDVHGDGWTDVITRRPVHANGLSLYANIGGKFVRQEMDLGPVENAEVFNLALADVDGDALLDLFVSTIGNGDFLFFNRGGDFNKENVIQLREASMTVSASVSFADMDQDGDVDILLGKWAPRGGTEAWILRPAAIANEVVWNDGDRKFRSEVLEGIPGQTLTGLVSDFNGDGTLDYFNGDDASRTDGVTFFDKAGKIRPRALIDHPFPYYTTSSMSYDVGDWNNDLRADYYGAQIAIEQSGTDTPAKTGDRKSRVLFEVCSQLGSDAGWTSKQIRSCAKELLSIDEVRNTATRGKLIDCSRSLLARDRALCGGVELLKRLDNKKRKLGGDKKRWEFCQAKLSHIPLMQRYCASLLIPVKAKLKQSEYNKRHKPALRNGNILMTAMPDGKFEDRAKVAQVQFPGWSWNSRFVDLDQDGWQDILVVNSMWLDVAASTSNVFYHNTGKGFSSDTEKFGFQDIVPSYSYVTLDYDRDGDVDVIRDNASLRMIVHRNDKPAGKALWINLRDAKGNSMGIGARVSICVDGETVVRPGKCQMRDVKASGGFMSSDPINAHFGLGDAKKISLIEVRWPDGEISVIRPTDLTHGEIIVKRL